MLCFLIEVPFNYNRPRETEIFNSTGAYFSSYKSYVVVRSQTF